MGVCGLACVVVCGIVVGVGAGEFGIAYGVVSAFIVSHDAYGYGAVVVVGW